MPVLSLKPNHKAVGVYYESLAKFDRLGIKHEGAVRSAFQALLDHCARQVGRVLVPEFRIKRKGAKPIIADAAILDQFTKALNLGLWEAKDTDDDLEKEIRAKFAAGYPRQNILFQTPHHAMLYQAGRRLHDANLTRPEELVHILDLFFSFRPPVIAEWEAAAAEFKERVPELGKSLAKLIARSRQTNTKFKAAFSDFLLLCRASLNPNLSESAVEEMIVQHLLTERIFRKVFDVGEFMRRNVIAVEIEKVIAALVSKNFNRDDFTEALEHFYIAIERAAETITDFSEKQKFLNTVYERFFQGFSVKIADTHGIVYTPQPLVDFMVESVEFVLAKHFGSGLAEKNVHILDPFTGTGNFVVNLMERLPARALPHKYEHELFCNEVMLLPYYVASMNIEHKYLEKVGQYEAFAGICLVDTFETAEKEQRELFAMTEENTARVRRQRAAPIKVIIANPPYNAGQLNENDNNKNRRYPEIERRISATYGKESQATLQRRLNDPYVGAIRFASDRIGTSGIVCFVTNDSFVEQVTFDGMRKCLAREFDLIYVLELGGNTRKNPDLSGTTHNVFGIQIGVSINLFIKLPKPRSDGQKAVIYYHSVPRVWRREQKYRFLDEAKTVAGVTWKTLSPDKKNNWITNPTDKVFDSFLPLGTKSAKAGKAGSGTAIFKLFSLGVVTNRDYLAHDFQREQLTLKARTFIDLYNAAVERNLAASGRATIESLIDVKDERIKWTRQTKASLERCERSKYSKRFIRETLYRPFAKRWLYFDPFWNEEQYKQAEIFPTPDTVNSVICVSTSNERPFAAIATDIVPNLVAAGGFGAGTQCFPLYVYSGDGRERRDNIPRAVLDRFIVNYDDDSITRLDIFNYVYGLLHHPGYRTRYADNLKRELPRIPLAPGFHSFAKAGAKLVDLHIHYEEQAEYPLTVIEYKDVSLDWRVETMKLEKDGTTLVYNDHFTFADLPSEVHEYRLGNRTALEWIIDQYRVIRNAEGDIVSDPNREDDEQYIAKLVSRVVTVSVETVNIVRSLSKLNLV